MSRSREHAWLYMKKCDIFRAVDVAKAAKMDLPHCQSMISRFKRRGYIETVCGCGTADSPFVYKIIEGSTPRFGAGNRSLTNTNNRPSGRKKTKQQMMWNTIRISRCFSIEDLLMTAFVSDKHAYWYLIRLERAGYIKAVNRVNTKRANQEIMFEHTRYKLVRYTGARAPIVRPDGLWDQNEQVLYPFID
jgi:hypothetical protein